MAIDLDGTYRVHNWPAVAVRIGGYPQRYEPYFTDMIDEEGNSWECETDEGEWVDDTECGHVFVIMVGDDVKHRVSIDDLVPLGEFDYCAECGQIGCGHDGRDREDNK